MAECEAHPVRYEDDCEFCQHDQVEQETALQALLDKNSQTNNRLQQSGAVIDPATFVDLRLNMLLQSLYGRKQLVRFETAFHEQVEQILKDAETQVTMQKLKVGNLVKFDPKKMKH